MVRTALIVITIYLSEGGRQGPHLTRDCCYLLIRQTQRDSRPSLPFRGSRSVEVGVEVVAVLGHQSSREEGAGRIPCRTVDPFHYLEVREGVSGVYGGRRRGCCRVR